MLKENAKDIAQIILSAVLLAVAIFIEHTFNLQVWQLLIVFLIPYLIVGFEVVKEAIEEIFHGHIFDEDFLMSIATIGAMLIGFLPNTEPMFHEAVLVMLLFKIGELLEEIADGKTEKSIEELMKIRPDYANLFKGDTFEKVDPNDVKVGDIILITPNEKVPLDGIVVEGESSLDTKAITGESIPQKIKENEEIISGTINLTSNLKVRVTKLFEESTASKIIELVKNAEEGKSKSENFITKFAKIYTPIVVILALIISFVPPLFTADYAGNLSIWLVRGLTFLVISCPCALVISVPLSFFGGIGIASKNGILIKGSNYIDQMAKAKNIVFDKTGTLTKGSFEVVAIHPEIIDEEKLLHSAAHVERFSNHPIAISLKQAFRNEDDGCKVTDIEDLSGEGIIAKVNDNKVAVGNKKLMERVGVEHKDCEHKGTIVHVALNNQYVGHIVISDKIKDDAVESLSKLEKMKIKTMMLTGDHEAIAKEIAAELGVGDYKAELLPQDKLKLLEEIKEKEGKNERTIFVGDGANDAPVLAGADVGIAMGALGSDTAIEAADIVLMDDKVRRIVDTIKISKKTVAIAKENIIFAIVIKVAVLILASFGYAPMWLAVFADVGVTLIAILNALRMLKMKID